MKILLSLILLSFAQPSLAVEKPKTDVLWDSWYTVTLTGNIPYGFYHDRIEKKDGKVAFKNEFWKKEEGSISEEKLVVFAEDNLELKPVLFNFQSTYKNTKIDIDGNVKDKNIIVKARKDGKDLKPITRNLTNGTFFSSLFPVWVGKRLETLKEGKLVSFTTLLEDNLDKGYAPVSGSFRLEKNDEFAKQHQAKKIAVDYQNRKSIWYLGKNGEAIKILMKDPDATVEKTSEAIARKFLIPNDGL